MNTVRLKRRSLVYPPCRRFVPAGPPVLHSVSISESEAHGTTFRIVLLLLRHPASDGGGEGAAFALLADSDVS